MTITTAPTGLAALQARLRHDLEILQYPPADWVIPQTTAEGAQVVDVVIIGAGMCGLTAAFALRRAGTSNIRVLDAAEAGREGPWVTYARMETLRSPKHLAGPAMGLPSLAFRSWYEAQWGAQSWHRLGLIPRTMWMDYLCWYRRVLDLPVENRRRVAAITPRDHGFDLSVEGSGAGETIAARKIVLATGREGTARPRVPGPLQPFLGPRCRHSSAAIDFAAMAGHDVAVVGFSASAVDNAAEALEAGASRVHFLVRAPAVPRINKMKGTLYPGFTHGFPLLPAAERLGLLSYVFNYRIAPPRDSVLRVWRHPNVRLHLDAGITAARESGGRLHLEIGKAHIAVDHVVLGTGFHIGIGAPDEFESFFKYIKSFRDYTNLISEEYIDEFLDFPDLGPAFEFQERVPGSAAYLKDVHNFTFAATVSHGNVSGDIPCVSDGAARLAAGIAAGLFSADFPAHFAALKAYDEAELLGDEIPGCETWWPDPAG